MSAGWVNSGPLAPDTDYQIQFGSSASLLGVVARTRGGAQIECLANYLCKHNIDQTKSLWLQSVANRCGERHSMLTPNVPCKLVHRIEELSDIAVMRICYLIPLREPIGLTDHWSIPLLGGECKVIVEGKYATGFEVIFSNQPVELAPFFEKEKSGESRHHINLNDTLLTSIRFRLRAAFSFLKCFFGVDIDFDEVSVDYVGESEEEKKLINITRWSVSRDSFPILMPFDLLARALIAAGSERAPEYEASLLNSARAALLEERYIDSFRYSFLLIEFAYGGGKFQKRQLIEELEASDKFVDLLASAIASFMAPKGPRNSDTDRLLKSSPALSDVISHLVEKRGFYFHANTKRKNAWQPHEQQVAETLALLSLEIAMQIASVAAGPMFDEVHQKRFIDDAHNAGATLTMNVKFRFRDPNENFIRNAQMNISGPGTIVTPRVAIDTAMLFLRRFDEVAPASELLSAVCTKKGTQQRVFDLKFFGGDDLDIEIDQDSTE